MTHEFTVPASLEVTWAAFDDIASVGECFPGAVVTSVDGDTFSGTVKVKLGPIALVYGGTGTFVEKDRDAGTMTIQAKGKDKRGNGTAGADVVARLVAEGDASTKVTVHTDLAITGKPAQFGRGVMQDVSDKLLGQFVECLAVKVGRSDGEAAGETGAESGARTAADDAGSAPVPAAAAGPDAEAGGGAPAAAPEPGAHRAAAAPSGSGGDDALDLGATVVPILLRTYGKQVAVGLGLVALLAWLRGRRR
nr:SRPBCC family protein [Nocardioides perillae]